MDAFNRMTLEEIATAIPDGALLGVPADYSGVPMAATRALIARGARGLRLYCLPLTTVQGDMLIGAGCVASVEAAAVTLGEFGLALMYFAVPRVILFREEHSPRTLVEKVDFISAPGTSPPEVWRRGGPRMLVTNRAVFSFNPGKARFRLESVHGGDTPETVAMATGFDFDRAPQVGETPAPTPERLERLRRDIAPQIAGFYPQFAARIWGVAA